MMMKLYPYHISRYLHPLCYTKYSNILEERKRTKMEGKKAYQNESLVQLMLIRSHSSVFASFFSFARCGSTPLFTCITSLYRAGACGALGSKLQIEQKYLFGTSILKARIFANAHFARNANNVFPREGAL